MDILELLASVLFVFILMFLCGGTIETKQLPFHHVNSYYGHIHVFNGEHKVFKPFINWNNE